MPKRKRKKQPGGAAALERRFFTREELNRGRIQGRMARHAQRSIMSGKRPEIAPAQGTTLLTSRKDT